MMNGGDCLKLVFASNYFNHHQKPFCEEMFKRLGDDFVFISTSIMSEERRKLGYSQNDMPIYVHCAYGGAVQMSKAIELINEADVVIAGAAPDDMFSERIRLGKLLLRYGERPYKKKASFLKKAYHFIKLRKRDLWKNNIYMLCASAYAATDYTSIGMYKKRTYKWGYFPSVKKYSEKEFFCAKKTNTILWCGRFLDWKHPDDAIQLARKLKENGYKFCLNMIGTGAMEKKLKYLTKKYSLADSVHFLGSMSPEQVRTYMEEAGIYLFTSDRKEGWGAVLNESMNSGCAVIASHLIGSVPYLINDGINGLIYKSGNVDELFEKVKYLLDTPAQQSQIGREAYCTINGVWNADIASERLLRLTEVILSGEESPRCFETGPCSFAEIIEEDFYG